MQFTKYLLALTAASSLLFVSATQAEVKHSSSFSPQQTQQIEKIVHDYLIQNPQVMVDVINALQKQQQQTMTKKAQASIVSNAKNLFNAAGSPVAGNPSGNITLVEFFDYQCPHCKTMGPAISNLIKSNPQLRVVYKQLPIFPNSAFIARAALAAANQGKFQAFHDALIQAPDPIGQADVLKIAQNLGIDTKRLQADMNNTNITNELTANVQLANALGLQGTPAFIVANNIGDKDKMRVVFIPGEVSQADLQNSISQVTNSAGH